MVDLIVRILTNDEQHKKLIVFLNELQDAIMAKEGNQALGTILTELSRYGVYPFPFEETPMKKFNYGDFTTPTAMHDAVVKNHGL